MSNDSFLPYRPARYPPAEMIERARSFFDFADSRRSVREFSAEPVDRRLIEIAIETASTAPSGAHRQPWKFVAVNDPTLKREIRSAAEREERESYEGGRMPAQWREAIAPLGTNWQKPYLETVPWIVVVFEESYQVDSVGEARPNYYVKESVGIACGLFITALHWMGLSTLTHTPSPMAFLSEILERPKNEKPYILFPIGYAASNARVPRIRRKTLEEVAVWTRAEAAGPA